MSAEQHVCHFLAYSGSRSFRQAFEEIGKAFKCDVVPSWLKRGHLRSVDEEGYKEAEVAGALEFVNAAKNDGQYPGDHPAAHYSALVTSDFIQILFQAAGASDTCSAKCAAFSCCEFNCDAQGRPASGSPIVSILVGCSPQRSAS
jgi:hypothetical protein